MRFLCRDEMEAAPSAPAILVIGRDPNPVSRCIGQVCGDVGAVIRPTLTVVGTSPTGPTLTSYPVMSDPPLSVGAVPGF